jgi:hypothetical protein
VASIPRTARTRRKKYVPSAEQRAKDARAKERLDHLTNADLKNFDHLLQQAIKREK